MGREFAPHEINDMLLGYIFGALDAAAGTDYFTLGKLRNAMPLVPVATCYKIIHCIRLGTS